MLPISLISLFLIFQSIKIAEPRLIDKCSSLIFIFFLKYRLRHYILFLIINHCIFIYYYTLLEQYLLFLFFNIINFFIIMNFRFITLSIDINILAIAIEIKFFMTGTKLRLFTKLSSLVTITVSIREAILY